MGANNFREYATGKDMRSAFNQVARQARHEYGHDTYSGTIGAKDDVVNFGALPKGTTPEKIEGWVFDYEEWSYDKRGVNPVPAQHQALVKRVSEQGYDKWGPCAGFEITNDTYALKARVKKALGRAGTQDKVFVFLGMAPS